MERRVADSYGLLVDISNPEKPVRLDAVSDTNFSLWHTAVFSNDGSKIVFTDEGTLNTRMEAAREVTFDRKKGAFIHNFAQVRPDEQLLYIAATCKTEGFTPFPAP